MSAMVLDVTPQVELEQRALSLPDEARGVAIRDQQSFERAGLMIIERIKPLRAEAARVFDPIIASAYQAHKKALAAKANVEAPLIESERILKGSISKYLQEQEEIRAAEEHRLREQHEREVAELRKRQREEEEARHAEEIERELELLPSDAPREVVEEICNRAPEEVMLVVAPVPVVAKTYAPFAGISGRETWSAELVDIKKLAAEVAAGRQSPTLISANMTALNQMARAMKQGMNVPGVRAVKRIDVATTGRK